MDFDPSFDLYEELEVSPSATQGTIEAAWRSLLKRHHPDIVGAELGAAKAKRLNVAHDILADAAERRRYDKWRAARAKAKGRASEPEPGPKRRSEPRQKAPKEPKGPRQPPPPEPEPAPPPPTSLRLRVRPDGRPYEPGPDYRRAGLIVVAGLAVIGFLRIINFTTPTTTAVSVQTPGPAPTESPVFATPLATEPSDTRSPSATAASPSPASASPAASGRPSARPTPTPRPTATPRPTPVPPFASRKGKGSGGPWPADYQSGAYTIDYTVDSPRGGGCSWVLYMTDSSGFEAYAASTYPYDGPDTSQEVETIDPPGLGSMRVDSDCPSWTFTLRWSGS